MTNYSYILAGFAVIALISVFSWIIVLSAWTKLRNMGIAFLIIAAGFLHSMATKPSARITYDDYLEDIGSYYTNDFSTIVFMWRKTNAALPSSQPLYISSRPDSSSPWTRSATTTVGSSTYELTIPDATNRYYYVWHEWIPPSPVHTNGVWIGTVIEKARGSSGVDKLLIINGKLERDGKIIAPPER